MTQALSLDLLSILRTASLPLCLALVGCAGLPHDTGRSEAQAAAKGACDGSLATALQGHRDTTLLLTRSYKAGEAVALANSPANAPVAPVDLCLVKLLVGPGHPGSAGAPSTSKGIGIEVWMPAHERWNGIIRAYGSGGWAGGVHTDVTRLTRTGAAEPILLAAVATGYAISSSDHGHAGSLALGTTRDASFALREDGSINTTLWQDFSERSMHEQVDKTKRVVRAYFGRPHRYAYWDGFSTGGRQGYKIAQRYPRDVDGILAGAPAFHWTRFITAELYPQLVMLRELGAAIAPAKLNAVSAAANAACGGGSLGFLTDPLSCRYDPTRDARALCVGVAGLAGAVGSNADTARCLTLPEAQAINTIWYGLTADGRHPDPALDNGGGPALSGSRHLWFGLSRGANLTALAGTLAFPIASAQVALSLQDPRIAQSDRPYLANATANGQDKWKELDYASLARAYQRGLDLQREFGHINTEDADLSGARQAGLKVLSYHGLADELIMPQGSSHYFARAAERNGGVEALQRFNRLFFIPGLAHDSSFARAGSLDPATGALTSPDKLPLPQPATGRDELFEALRALVERGVAPERIDVRSRNGSVSMPLCSYPRKATHDGIGPMTAAASYICR